MNFKTSPPGFKNIEGPLVETIQMQLQTQGFPPQGGIDGVWGNHTVNALCAWQSANNTTATGIVDDSTWAALIKTAVPSIFQRALQLTGAWEGTGYGGANGNFDGQGITWGVVGFTWKNGELQGILSEILSNFPAVFNSAFGSNSVEMQTILSQPLASQMVWARNISTNGGNNIAQPWSDAFLALGNDPNVQNIENNHAQHYWNAGAQFSLAFGLSSPAGQALCFDIAVQDTVTDAMITDIQNKIAAGATSETDKMVIIAHVIASNANPTYYNDVLKRKMTFATGQGTVHDDLYDITCWGIS